MTAQSDKPGRKDSVDRARNPKGLEGHGGSRHGFRSSNEIEDMEIFDADPGKDPSDDRRHDPKSIDENGYRERK